jgi:hypothetical protein
LSNHAKSEEDSDSDLAHPLEWVYVQHTLKMWVRRLKEKLLVFRWHVWVIYVSRPLILLTTKYQVRTAFNIFMV